MTTCGGGHGLYTAEEGQGSIRCVLCGNVALAGPVAEVAAAALEWYERPCERPSANAPSRSAASSAGKASQETGEQRG